MAKEIKPSESDAVANTTKDPDQTTDEQNMKDQELMDEDAVHAKVAKGTAMEHLPNPTHPLADGGAMQATKPIAESQEAKIQRLSEQLREARRVHKANPTEENMSRMNDLEEEIERTNQDFLGAGDKKH
jgi:hypothetical protein